MPAATTQEPDVREQAREILAAFNSFNAKFPGMTSSVKEAVEAVAPLKGVDIKKLLDSVEQLRAAQESLTRTIRSGQHGYHVAGLEDEKENKQFSIIRTAWAQRTGRWDEMAPYEKEVLSAYEEKYHLKHVMGVQSEGGSFVPDQLIANVIGPLYTRSVLVALQGDGTTRVSVLDGLFGGEVRIPKFKGGMLAFWTGELSPYTESSTKTADITLRPRKLTLLTRLSEEMRKFGAYGFENLIRQDMARAAAKKIDHTAFYGSGNDDTPRGLAKTPGIGWFSAQTGAIVTASPVDAQGGELNFDGLSEMIGSVEDLDTQLDDTAAIISAPRYFRRLKALKVPNFSGQTDGNYLLGAPLLTDARLSEFIGDYDRTTQIPTTNLPGATLGWSTTSTDADFGDVFLGNWGEMLLGRWGAMEIISDEGLGAGFLTDQTFIKMRMFLDVGVRRTESFVMSPDVRMRNA